jgi:hypothetical protein
MASRLDQNCNKISQLGQFTKLILYIWFIRMIYIYIYMGFDFEGWTLIQCCDQVIFLLRLDARVIRYSSKV